MLLRYQSLLSSLLMLFLLGVAPASALAQSGGIVEGRVVDASSGAPLPGANVVVKGTSIGAATDANGRYELRDVPPGTQRLSVSFVSYQDTSTTVEIDAGETVTVNVELSSEVTRAGEVVVTGIRQSQMQSVRQKKQAVNVVDALSADDIGDLPEKNVAEAVQRLPGIVMTNDRTEGRFVSIRGGSADLNNVTLNGTTMASTTDSRATGLDLLPANMVSNITVTKAVTPDMSANAIGGSVNIETLTAFDRAGDFVFGTLRGMSHDQQVPGLRTLRDSRFPFKGSLTGGAKFGADDQFGALVTVSGSRRDFTTSGYKAENWNWANEANIQTTQGSKTLAVPEASEQIVESNRRRRVAVNTSFDWRPSEETAVYVRPYFTYTDEDKIDNELEYVLGDLSPSESARDNVVASGDNRFEFPHGYGSLDASLSEEEERLWGTSAGVEHDFANNVSLSASGSFSRGVFDFRKPDGEFQTPGDPDMAGSDPDVSAPEPRAGGVADMSNFLFDFFPSDPNFLGSPQNYLMNKFEVDDQRNTENTYAAQTDVRIPFELGDAPGYLKTGGRFQYRSKDVDVNKAEYDFTGFGEDRLTLGDGYAAPRVQTQQLDNRLMPFANTQAFADGFFGGLCNPPADFTERNGGEECRASGSAFTFDGREIFEEDSENEEGIYAGYAMASVKFGALTALAGARVEHTSTSSTRFELLPGGETGSSTFESAYTNILPSVHLTYSVGDHLQFRGAWTNTIGRPDYDELASFREVEEENGEVRINQGNPDLDPYRSMNFDLSAEYYFENGGLVSLAGFYKRIDNAIYEDVRRDTDGPFDVPGVNGPIDEVEVTQPENADLGTVLGLEAAYQQPFTFLPAPLSGLGVNSNVTVTDSEVDVPDRGDLPFFQQADLVYNIIPYFQRSGFQARVAINHRGDYLLGLADRQVNDTWVKDRTTVDINASYQFESLLAQPTLMVQVENLTNEPEVEYAGGNEDHLSFHYLSGRTVSVGLSMEL
ncbi:TonB-dependent receptor [Salinibacter ruber]|uniref:TonB-dependent receptor n=1 Tax=Salinibacter ruber TaxID=146919 RepID=UPI00216851DA|nr:TonB-dependent receptor [Salinibacter ruber]MCS4195886.1 TonB-dependent receptor [Salinibacter ruber]